MLPSHPALPTAVAREASKREVRHVGNTLGGQIIDESVVATLGDVVSVLTADNLRDHLRLGQLPGRDRAEADMRAESGSSNGSSSGATNPPSRRFTTWSASRPRLRVYGVDDLLARACVKPGTIGAAACADFGHDDQIIRIRMQRLSDDLIGYLRTVEIAGIDVVHA
jgi:hypothetical protein